MQEPEKENAAKGLHLKNHRLANLTWFKVGGPAEVFYMPESEIELIEILQDNYQKPQDQRKKITVLGACSNVLIHDDGIRGIVIKLGAGFSQIELDKKNTKITVGASCMNYSLSNFCIKNNIHGFEFLSGIPGSVGGGVVMNAGAYDKEFKDIVYSVRCINFRGEVVNLLNNELNFEYRYSKIQDQELIVVGATFAYKDEDFDNLSQDDSILQIKNKVDKIKSERRATQPVTEKTCGSTFRNLKGMSAWRIVDKLGMRGRILGGAMVSEKHSNFLINFNRAKAIDIHNLGEQIRVAAKEKLGVDLHWEIKFLGF